MSAYRWNNGGVNMKQSWWVLFCLSLLAACATTPPGNTVDICSIFLEKSDWYASAEAAASRWGAPIPVQMAIINQESAFVDDARPPRYHFLGVPLWRTSSAYGYGQAKDETWHWYRENTGNTWADRDEFEDTVDFIGWYMHQSFVKLGIAKSDAYHQYLAYHEGQGGFQHGTWRTKPWLQGIARRVAATAWRYQRQLGACQATLARASS
jgi:hypothetical protein